MIYFIADLHLNHDRDFIYKPRGFNSIEEMNEAILTRWNNIVSKEDDVYVLGDLTLGSSIEYSKEMLEKLNGKLYIVLGNHDTLKRIAMYHSLPNVVEVSYGFLLKYQKKQFFLTHYPTLTGNFGESHSPWNIYGHTHQKNIYDSVLNPRGINVGCEAVNCTPISIDKIISAIKEIG